MAEMTHAVWTPGYALLMFIMWWVMMTVMMLPSAAPMILLFARVDRRQRETSHHVTTTLFVLGYLVAWSVFSVIAVILQWEFERARILSPMLAASNAIFGGVLLLAAGIYQLTPIKHSCLMQCRSPVAFLSTHWRAGARGALHMGLVHGFFCVGCCWLLMGLLFFGGVMNVYWIAGVALLVLLEKTVPGGHWISYGTGVALLVTGVAMLGIAL